MVRNRGAGAVRPQREGPHAHPVPAGEGRRQRRGDCHRPGGAFLHHTFGSGGYEAAEWFRSHGFATFILKYRVEATPRDEDAHQAYCREKMAGYIAGGKSGVYAPATPD